MQPQPQSPSLLRLSFNQNNTCFAAASATGFQVFRINPFTELFRRDFSGSGIGHVEMLFHSNILALVGGGSRPQFPPNKVMLWDDNKGRCFGELSFRSAVRSIRLRRDRIVVVVELKVFVYNIADFKLLHQVETVVNPKGLCAVSQSAESLVLACPGLHKGQVRVDHLAAAQKRRTIFVSAHDSALACLALTLDGKFLATASSKGTLIRVFDSAKGTLLQEVRRGANEADIYSLSFSSTAQWLGVSSDKGTIHIFSLKVDSSEKNCDKSQSSSDSGASITPSRSYFSLIKKGVLPKYFNSEWSFAQFHLHGSSHYTVAFDDQKNTIIILGMDGSLYRCQFDPVHGGEMTQLDYHNFLKPEIAS